MDVDGQPSPPDPVEGRSYAYWTSWFGNDPPPPTDDPLAVARQGTSSEKCRLAVEKHLDDEVVDLLLHSGDTDVAASLARNTTVSTDTLQRLAELHPEHRHMIGFHPEAPAQLKEALPIGDHTSYALLRYYEQRGATDDVRRAIYQRYRTSPQPGGPLSAMSGERSRAWPVDDRSAHGQGRTDLVSAPELASTVFVWAKVRVGTTGTHPISRGRATAPTCCGGSRRHWPPWR